MAIAEFDSAAGQVLDPNPDDEFTRRGERLLFSNVGLSVVERLVTAVLNYLTLIILVRHLSVADFGVLSLSTSFVGPFGAATEFGLSGLLVRSLVERPREAARTLSSFFTLWWFMCSAALVIFLMVTAAMHYPREVAVPVALYGALTLISTPLSALGEYLNATARVYQSSLCNLAVTALTAAIVFALVRPGGASVWMLVLVLALMNALKLLAAGALTRRYVRIRPVVDIREWRGYLAAAAPLAGTAFIMGTVITSGPGILSKVSSLDQVAMYGVATRQIPLMNFFPASLLVSVFPLMCGYFAQGARGELERIWADTQRHLVLYGVTGLTFGFAYAANLMTLVYGPKYHAAATALIWAVAYSGLFALMLPYSNLLVAAHLQGRRFIAHCLSVPVMAALAIPLATRFGALGMVQALTGTTFFILVMYAFLVRHLVKWNPATAAAAALPPIISVVAAQALARLLGLPWPLAMALAGACLVAMVTVTRQVPLPRALDEALPRLRLVPNRS